MVVSRWSDMIGSGQVVGSWSRETRWQKERVGAGGDPSRCNVFWIDKGGKAAVQARMVHYAC